MSDPIAKLLVTLGMDSTEFSRGAKRALDDVSTMRSKISSAAGVIKGAVGGMITAMALDRIADLAMKGLEYASSLGEVAAQLGVTTKALQEYRYAASQAGIEQDEMDKALAQLTKRLGEAAEGAKAPKAALEKLGVSLRDANGHVIDAGDAIPLIAEGLQKIESPAERAAILVDLFGKAGQKLIPLMEGGAAGVNGLRDAAHKLGIVLSDEQIQKADETADKLSAMKQVLEAKIASTVADNADLILDLANALMKLVDAAGKAAKAWRYFSQLDWSPGAASFSDQFTAMQIRELGPGVELTDSAAAAIKARRDARFQGSGGSLLRVPPKSTARTPVQNTPWGPVNTNLNRRGNAITAAGFGRLDFAQFEPGGAAAEWIKTKGAIDGVAASAETAARRSFPELSKATGKLSDDMQALRATAQGILDRLFPEKADERRFLEEMATLDLALKKGQLTIEAHADAVLALRREYQKFGDVVEQATEIVNVSFGKTAEEMAEEAGDRIYDVFGRTKDNAETMKVQVTESFAQMVDGSLRELDRFISGIKSGNWLDIVGGLLNLIDSVVGVVTGGKGTDVGPFTFGKDRAPSSLPRFATGGSMMLGGLSGIDTNLLSLNGRPIARTTAGETMTISPSNDNRGGELSLRVIKGDMFDIIVEQKAARVVAAHAPGIAAAGSAQALSTLRHRQQRSLIR